jgi:hypothetical protein
MPHIDKHPAGAFSWVELATTDQNAAKNFYSSLFGWSAADMPMGPGEFYTLFKLEGRDAAACYTMRPDQSSQGMPPNWLLYVATEDADNSAKQAAAAGGQVLAPAFDVGEFGRMAVLQDPTGATFSVWQPKQNPGLGITGNNAFCWADLSTPDQKEASDFYSKVFGWQMMKDTDDEPHSGYLHIKNGEDFIGGIPPAQNRGNMPPHWLLYFGTANCEASVAKAKELGATIFLPPMKIEDVGTMSVLADPQGAVFALFQSGRK